MGKFYAVLVGINEYAVKPGEASIDLSGCLHDVELFKSYLEEKIPDDERQIFEPLLNHQATKAAVVDAIQNQLGEAGTEDTALFYFSGHGCQELAGEAIQTFTVGERIEALVCHDTFASDANTTLADLEIRYLFHQLSTKENPPGRIIIITDSCNSGGVTRSIDLIPRLGPVAGLRTWDQFIFHQDISERQMSKSASLDVLLPKARHVHLAACESQQSAFESTGQNGVFTSNLVQVLQHSGGRISFRDLHSRVKYLVRRKFKEQTPQIYSYDPTLHGGLGAGSADINTPKDLADADFLEGLNTQHKIRARVHFYDYNWFIDKGAIHGMPPTDIAFDKIKIKIIESIDGQDNPMTFETDIIEVEPGTTLIGFSGNPMDKAKIERYTAEIEGLYLDPMTVKLLGKQDVFSPLSDPAQAYQKELEKRNVHLVGQGNSLSADYKVIATEKSFSFTTAGSSDDVNQAKAICLDILRNSSDAYSHLVLYLSTMARWQFVLGLHNHKPRTDLISAIDWEFSWTPGTCRLIEDTIYPEKWFDEQRIHLDQGRTAEEINDPLNYPTISLELPQVEAAELRSYFAFRLRLQNRSKDPIYVSVLYLGQLFDVFSHVFVDQPNVVRLDGATDDRPGDTVWAFGTAKEGEAFALNNFIYDYNWEAETFYLKLLISNTEFELGNTFDQAALPPPGEQTRGSGEMEQYRSAAHPPIPDWATKMLEVRVKNPRYSNPSET